MTHPAATAVAALTGRRATAVHPPGGHVFTVDLAAETTETTAITEITGSVVAKRHAEPTAARAEVASLRWLAGGPVRLPRVLAGDDHWVIMEHVAERRPTARAAEALGRDLAGLHQTGAPAFGAAPPGGPADAWIGLAPMHNHDEPHWPSWYTAHRIEPYLRQALDGGTLDHHQSRTIGQVCDRIEDLAGPAEPPARLHGDLWSGNVLWAEDAWLIDPAAHGGHRETDLAMLALFGCPHLDRVLGAYHEATPLAPGWRDRVPLHQLFPLLVHTVLFGGGYANQAVAAAERLLSRR